MRSEEAQIGKQVRVRADHRSLTLRGLVGTIEKRWGAPHTSASTCCSTTALSSCSDTTSWRRSPQLTSMASHPRIRRMGTRLA